MARRGNSVIGIDLGKHVFKGVLLQRKSDARYVLTSYASRPVPEEMKTADELAQQIKGLGEISRLMLAIKSALAAQDAIPLLVFDEIDANVGGEIANAVGAKMRDLARAHQVLCITHLPQVAAAANSHFLVAKAFAQGRTYSHLRDVSGKARQEEIARMLGGQTDSALKHAAALLKQGVA